METRGFVVFLDSSLGHGERTIESEEGPLAGGGVAREDGCAPCSCPRSAKFRPAVRL